MHQSALGAYRSASCYVIAVLLIVHSTQVEGYDQSNFVVFNNVCGCQESPKSPRVEAKTYCNNAGVELKSRLSENFECGQCKTGKYHKVKVNENKVIVTEYQQLKTRGVRVKCDFTWTTRREWVEFNPSRAKRDEMRLACLRDLTWENEPYNGPEIVYQTCQHCPIFTIANSVQMVSSIIWNLETYPAGGDVFSPSYEWNRIMQKFLMATRCWTSCTLAWQSGSFVVRMDVLESDSLSLVEKNVELFPEIQGDKIAAVVPGQVSHSVIGFLNQVNVANWLTSDEGKLYIETIKKIPQYSKTFTWLPPPTRQCRLCPNGKYLIAVRTLVDGNFNENELGFMKTQIEELRQGLGYIAKQNSGHDISWLKLESFQDFDKIEICEQCPAGTYFDGNEREYTTTILPPKSMTESIKRTKRDMLSKWTLLDMRCTPCEEGFIRTKIDTEPTRCTLCKEDEFSEYTEESVKIRSPSSDVYTLQRTMLPTRCSGCPAGSERKFETPFCSTEKISEQISNPDYTVITKNDCCTPCTINFYTPANSKKCVNVDSNKATKVPYGSTQQIQCQSGTELRACKAKKVETNDLKFKLSLPDFCIPAQDINSEDDDWRVCLECTAVERPEKVDLEPRCVMCNGDGEDFEALGEFYNKSTMQCESCDDCSVFEPKVEWRSFFATDTEYKNAMSVWLDESNRIDSYRVHNRWHYKHFDIKNPCKPLQRRELSWNASAKSIKIDRDDRVKVQTREKWKGQLFGEGAVAAFHAVDYERFLDGARSCSARRCEKICEAWYHYSQGCGASAVRAALWVQRTEGGAWRPLRLEELEAQLRTLAGGPAADPVAELAKWKLKHHGHCVECTLCADGQYNPECNRFAEGVLPEGRCEGCTTQCEGGEFLWHKGGLRGCAPLVDELKGRVLTDYVCRRCPTWVRRAERMYAVLGCGFKETFEWWKIATFVPQYDMLLTKAQALAKAAFEHPDVEVKFKPFHHLGAYCPDGHFFNQQEKDCAFKAESGFALHHAEMSFGYEAFRLECCQLCEICDADRYRMTAQYAECTGESMLDTQAKGCGDRCESGFYVKNETELECVACTEC